MADEWRPHAELHAYMPGLGPTEPFLDPSRLELCRRLSERIDDIEAEYALLCAHAAAFQHEQALPSEFGEAEEGGAGRAHWRIKFLFELHA